MSNVIIFPYQKENILCRKWYVLNLVCFGSGTATFDERGTIESEIEERCRECGKQRWEGTDHLLRARAVLDVIVGVVERMHLVLLIRGTCQDIRLSGTTR